MKKIISFKLAGNILLVCMGLLVIAHLLILFRIIPYDMVWGGQIKDASSLLVFEVVALVVTLLFAMIIAMKVGYIKAGKLGIVANIGMWVIFIYFVLNTLGNIASSVSIENLVFAPFTIILALLALRLAVEK
jgi:hypothetical protein